MPERPYFDESGEPSDAPGRFVHIDDLDALTVGPGLQFRPVTTDTLLTNFVAFEPNVPTPTTTTATCAEPGGRKPRP
jgi:hypothetical protein